MEELNKKTLLHIFLGFIVLQTFILLAVSANFLLAQTTSSTDSLTIQFTNIPSSPLSGDQIIYAQTNNTVGNIEFKVIPGIGGAAYTLYEGELVSSSDNEYYFTWPTTDFTDGIYDVRAITSDGTNTVIVDVYDFQVQNETAEETAATNPTVEITVADSGNRKDFQATSNMPLESIMFHFDDSSDSANSTQMPGTLLTSDLMNWTLNLSDGYLMDNLSYNFYAIGFYEGISYVSINDIFIPENNADISSSDTTMPDDTQADPINTTTTPLTLTFLEQFESPLSGDQQISITSNQEVFNCVFKIYGPRYAEFPAIKDNPTDYHIILHTKDFPDGYYTIKAVTENNIEIAEIRLDVKIENQITLEPNQPPVTEPVYYPTEPAPTETISMAYPDQSISDSSIIKIDYPETTYLQPEQMIIKITPECINQGIDNQEECDQLMKSLFRLTFECRNANITDIEECDKFMMENFLPEECRQQGIIDKEECDYLLRNIYRDFEIVVEKIVFTDSDYKSPLIKEIIETELPEECRAANITTKEECEKYMFEKFAPDDCREAGISNPEACKKYMFEKYNGTENTPQNEFPIECQKANVQTIEECNQIMKRIYLPQECKAEGIENENECEFYLNEKYMPQECREAGAKSRSECDKIMFKKFSPPECREAGIENEQECQEFMFNKYTPQVRCDNLEDWQCNNFIKERHLGNIVAKQIVYNRINEKKEEITGKSMKAEDLEIKIIQEEKIVPFLKKDIGIRIIATNESIVLNEEDNLIQAAPIALMIDSDEDGLPDDMEKRFGTDPFKADTDEDGYNDGEEIKNGHNPLGEGKFETELAPIEKAIMGNKSLGHPIIEGEEVENFSVENISNMEDAQGNSVEGYVLSGKTKPNSVATLYIYSDLPIVVTVNADKYGNWQYQLDQSLIEGEHEVYVAINDDTGKVIEKSKPLNFFIKEASAVSVKDFVSVAKASSENPKESEISIYYYLLITLFMAIAGVFLFLAVIISRKKNQTLQ